MTPIPDVQAGTEPKTIGKDESTPKMLALQQIVSLYFQTILACPHAKRTTDTCESCAEPQKVDCDMYGKMWDSLEEKGG